MVSSKRAKELWSNEEYRKRQSESHKGKSHTVSNEVRLKLSEMHKGKKLSDETKIKLSESHKGKVCKYKGKKKEEYKFLKRKKNMGSKGHLVSNEARLKISKKNSGKGNGRWNGGRKITKEGYIKIYSPNHKYKDSNGYVFEHRLNCEKKINRYLKKEEEVHHLNFCKSDNCIENLMIFNSKGEHRSFHIKIKQFGKTNPILKQISERWDKYLPKKESVELVPIQSTTNIMGEA